MLQFIHFDLEYDAACRFDYVEIRDGDTSVAPTVGKFCGETLPAIFESSENGLWVKFRSDSSSHAKGFMAKWSWIQRDGDDKDLDDSYNKGCGGVFTNSVGTISSPSYPDIYPLNSDCLFIIKPDNAKKIRLDFMSFDIENESLCSYDHLMVRAGSSKQGKHLARLCGDDLPEPIISDQGALWIRFKSDDTASKTGFSASWRVLE